VLPVCCRRVASLLPLKCLPDNDVKDVATFGSYIYLLPYFRSNGSGDARATVIAGGTEGLQF
jgi:hypothetical protein